MGEPARSVIPEETLMRRHAAVVIALLFATGCNATDPRPIAATLVLETVSGEALPAVLRSGEFGTTTLLADTLLLREDGTGTRIRRVHLVDDIVEIPDPGPYRRYVNEFTYELVGGQFTLEFPCPGLGLCVAPPHVSGALSGEVLTASELGAPGKELTYLVKSGAAPTTE